MIPDIPISLSVILYMYDYIPARSSMPPHVSMQKRDQASDVHGCQQDRPIVDQWKQKGNNDYNASNLKYPGISQKPNHFLLALLFSLHILVCSS